MSDKEAMVEFVGCVLEIRKQKSRMDGLLETINEIPPGSYRVGNAILRLDSHKGKRRSEVIEITEEIA